MVYRDCEDEVLDDRSEQGMKVVERAQEIAYTSIYAEVKA